MSSYTCQAKAATSPSWRMRITPGQHALDRNMNARRLGASCEFASRNAIGCVPVRCNRSAELLTPL